MQRFAGQWPSQLNQQASPVDNSGFVSCHGKLRLDGLQLVDEHGAPVQLMGVSSHGLHWFPDCSTKESITHLVQTWGITVFRASMYVGEGGYATDASIKTKVLDIVQWTAELGVYVIIDWHMLTPGNPDASTYSGADAFWEDIAVRYRDSKHVLYEIANEPNGVEWPTVLAYHNRIIGVIRAKDPETVILAGTTTWSQDLHLAAEQGVAQPHNVMYVFHFYAGSDYHMGLLPRVRTAASQIPIFVTEWGATMPTGDGGVFLENGFKFVDEFRSIGSKGVKLSWTAWSIADKEESSACFLNGACASRQWEQVSCSGAFIRAYIRTHVQRCEVPTTPAPPVTSAPPATPTPPQTPAPPLTCEDVWGSAACDDAQGGCSTCGGRIQWMVDNAGMTEAEARNSIAENFPAECGPCASSTPPATPTPPSGSCYPQVSIWGTCTSWSCCQSGLTCYRKSQWYAQCRESCPSTGWDCTVLVDTRTCDAVLDSAACDDAQGGCSTCRGRIQWMVDNAGMTEAEARNSIAQNFPAECGPCGVRP